MDEQREQNGAEVSAVQSEDVSEIDMSVPEHGSKVYGDETTEDRLQLRKTEAETGIALEMGINGGDRRSLGPVVDGHDGTLQFVGGVGCCCLNWSTRISCCVWKTTSGFSRWSCAS